MAEFSLPIDPDVFLRLFWLDSSWYEKQFLIDKLEDLDVSVGRWHAASGGSGFRRNVKSMRPCTFPMSWSCMFYTRLYNVVDSNDSLINSKPNPLKAELFVDDDFDSQTVRTTRRGRREIWPYASKRAAFTFIMCLFCALCMI